MNQHEFVAWVKTTRDYDPDETYDNAHYPISKRCGGENTIPLHPMDHHIHGIWQSVEMGKKCFYEYKTSKTLKAPNYFPLGWFDAWDIYEEWSGGEPGNTEKQKEARKKNGKTAGIRNLDGKGNGKPVSIRNIETNEVIHATSIKEAALVAGLGASSISRLRRKVVKVQGNWELWR